MKLLLIAVGMVLVFEAVPWFLSPGGVRRLLRQVTVMSDRALRLAALAMMTVGLLLVYAGTH